jgi:glycerophosphoryl diester phosphodiesterase
MRRAAPMVAVLTALVLTSSAAVPAATSTTTLVSAHRGAYRVAGTPESTMTAFRYAWRHGADVIEFDVRWTKDQRKYVLHDDTLGRTTNGTGRLEDHTAGYIRSVKVDGGERIPSFREVVAYASKVGLQINPELKPVAGYPFTDAQAKSYVAVIYLYGMERRTVVSSMSAAMLRRVRKFDTKKAMRYSLIQQATKPLHEPDVVAAAGSIYMPVYLDLTADYVAALHRRGVQIWGWPIRNETDRAAALAVGVDVLVVDDAALDGHR